MSDLQILGIPGSLRRTSFNKAALRAAQELAPAGMKIEIFELHDIPSSMKTKSTTRLLGLFS